MKKSLKSLIKSGIDLCQEKGMKKFLAAASSYIIWAVLPESKIKRLISRSKLLTTTYFYIFNAFYFEERTILQGKAKNADNPLSRARMIRLTHALEKGLTARDRRALFFDGKIDELLTVTDSNITAERKSANGDFELDRQIKWVLNTIKLYFSVVEQTEQIESAQARFQQLLDDINYVPSSERTPHRRGERPQFPGSFNDFRTLAEQRTSTRWFTEETVPRDDLDKAIDTALQSPTACNKQSYEFKIYDNKEDIINICDLPLGAHGFKQNIPCLIVIVGKQRAYHNARDKHNVYIDASLASMTLQYALESMGLASCCINWHSNLERDIKMGNLLRLDDDETVIMLLAVGYPDPDDLVAYSEKRPLAQMRTYNKLDN